jgi:hypothetical protein
MTVNFSYHRSYHNFIDVLVRTLRRSHPFHSVSRQQLLAPPVGALVAPQFRLRTQTRLLDAIRFPPSMWGLSPNDAQSPPPPPAVIVPLFAAPNRRSTDHIVTASVQFGKRVGVYGESVPLHITLTSRFPSAVTFARVQLAFDVPQYNRELVHCADVDGNVLVATATPPSSAHAPPSSGPMSSGPMSNGSGPKSSSSSFASEAGPSNDRRAGASGSRTARGVVEIPANLTLQPNEPSTYTCRVRLEREPLAKHVCGVTAGIAVEGVTITDTASSAADPSALLGTDSTLGTIP